jgi:purine nucleoside phosphorylase
MQGPAYETCAEALAAVSLGADAVTMSSFPELIHADRASMVLACLSWISNHTANVGLKTTDHREVLDSGRAAAAMLFRILKELVHLIR